MIAMRKCLLMLENKENRDFSSSSLLTLSTRKNVQLSMQFPKACQSSYLPLIDSPSSAASQSLSRTSSLRITIFPNLIDP